MNKVRARVQVSRQTVLTCPVRRSQTRARFAACCTKNTPLSNTTIPAWCSGAWTLSRTPSLQKFKAYNLPAPQQCYSENNDAYACDWKSDFCFFQNGSEVFSRRNESVCAQTSSLHDTTGAFAGSWGSGIYLHTDGFVNEVVPLDLLNSRTWERKSNAGIFEPRQYDVSFQIEVAPSLKEGMSMNLSFGREGVVFRATSSRV